MSRRGVALIVVLWVLAAAGTAAAAGMRAVRVSGATAVYRAAHTRARWAAAACLEIARARLEGALRRAEAGAWSEPERAASSIGEHELAPGLRCSVSLAPNADSSRATVTATGRGKGGGYDLPVIRETWGRGAARVGVLTREIM